MVNSISELEFSTEEISQVALLQLSDDAAPREKSSAGGPEKTGYPDPVYVMAANIFQGIRMEKSPEKVIIKYGNEPLHSSAQSEDETLRRLSYELAFSALKYQDILETILIDSYVFPSTTIPDHLSSLIIVMLYDFQDRKFQTRVLPGNEESISEVQEVEDLLIRLSPPVLPLCSMKEVHLCTDKFFRLEPSEITNGCFISVLTRERDPSEAVSVKDVLARAAAKGLLEGIELGKSSKREKKKKKSKASLPKAPANDNYGIQMKIAEFLSRESKAATDQSAQAPAPQKNATSAGSSTQIRKGSKPAPNPLMSTAMKNSCPSRPWDRHTQFGRPRPEGRVVTLKPVEIMLPPVMFPFAGCPGIRSQMPAPHFFCRWIAPKTSTPGSLPAPALSVSGRGAKLKENPRPTLPQRPRPWL